MNNLKTALNYQQAVHAQAEAEDGLNLALGALGSDNQILSLATPIFNAYTDLVQEILGVEAWEWLTWWMYETEWGQHGLLFTVNGTEYNPTNLDFKTFWILVCE